MIFINGNEIADKAAKRATRSQKIKIENKLSKSEFNFVLKHQNTQTPKSTGMKQASVISVIHPKQ